MLDLHIKAPIYFEKLVILDVFLPMSYDCEQQNIEKSGGKMTSKRKSGIIDRIIEKLPQIHICGYKYCGPNTDLKIHLAHGERGVNKLDSACMEHDIAYAESTDLKFRCAADKLLILRAIRCIYANDSRIGERFAALFVSWVISIKFTIGNIELYIDKVRKCLAVKFKK